MSQPKFDAVFFDLDGTLIDTESVAMQTGMAAFAAQGFDVDHAFMARLVGVDLPTAAGIIGAALPSIDHTALQSVWREGFSRAIEADLPLKSGAIKLLSARLVRAALVTSSGQSEAHHKLRLTGLDAYFETVVTLADVNKPKPHPEPYLLAATRLGVDPSRCLVFEDSETGAEAAYLAGCTVVQVPDVGPATGKWAHHLAPDLLIGAKMAGLLA
jgi:HAD superfamily hydrolase (TIGR01509 family)